MTEKKPDYYDFMIKLISVLRECTEKDWDGYGAQPIVAKKITWVTQFVCNLPSCIPVPDVAPESTGELCLIWQTNSCKTIMVSSTEIGMIHVMVLENSDDNSNNVPAAPEDTTKPATIKSRILVDTQLPETDPSPAYAVISSFYTK
jgi:hypothetical protein